jgi:hypothetical protein
LRENFADRYAGVTAMNPKNIFGLALIGLIVCVLVLLSEMPAGPPTEAASSPTSLREAAAVFGAFVWDHYWSSHVFKYCFTPYAIAMAFMLPIAVYQWFGEQAVAVYQWFGERAADMPVILLYLIAFTGVMLILYSLSRSRSSNASVLSDTVFAYGTSLLSLGAGYTVAGSISPNRHKRQLDLMTQSHQKEISRLHARLMAATEQLARCQGRIDEIERQQRPPNSNGGLSQ